MRALAILLLTTLGVGCAYRDYVTAGTGPMLLPTASCTMAGPAPPPAPPEPRPMRSPVAGEVAVLRLQPDDAEPTWRTAIAQALTDQGMTPHGVVAALSCDGEQPECVAPIARRLADSEIDYDLLVFGQVGGSTEPARVVLYDLRSHEVVRRFEFTPRDGDLVLPVSLPIEVAHSAADRLQPMPPLTETEQQELRCWLTDGLEGEGCPEADLREEPELWPLRGVGGEHRHVRWRTADVTVVMAWKDVEHYLDGMTRHVTVPRDAEYARVKLGQLREAIEGKPMIDVSSETERCYGRHCAKTYVEHDDRMDELVVRMLRSGEVEVHACGGPAIDALELQHTFDEEDRQWLEYRVPDGPVVMAIPDHAEEAQEAMAG